MIRLRSRALGLAALVAIGGCAAPISLVGLEGSYYSGAVYPAEEVPPAERTGAARIAFVTDRRPGETDEAFTHLRSASMAYGTAEVAFGGLDWAALLARSEAQGSHPDIKLSLAGVSGIGRFPPTPLAFSARGGRIVPDPAEQQAYAAAGAAFQQEIAARLARNGQDQVILYVHGFGNSFEDATTTLAGIWHASGRLAVPVAFTWPAGNPGPFGYFKDRESGEFAIFHLKETLRLLADVTGLSDIHVIAHSRGTDIATTALREMVIAARAAGRDPRAVLKVQNLILAAPDLDFGVVRQRLIAEQFGPAFGCVTVYLNPEDGALGFAQALMSGTRFGRITYADLGAAERQIFERLDNVYFIDVARVAGRSSHAYFRRNPAVLADMIEMLRSDAMPGDPGRRLSHVEGNFWRLDPGDGG